MANYDDVRGVEYARYDEDSTPDDPAARDGEAKIDEMYFGFGHLHVSVNTSEGLISLNIPILPMGKWDEFVDSLPVWGN